MIRILFAVVLVFLLAAGFGWLADHPGSIALTVNGYEISLSLMATAVIVLVGLVLLVIVWLVLRAILRAPRALRRQTVDRRRELGLAAQAKGLIAVGGGEARLALHYAAESRHYARHEPMTVLLAAQAAQLSGDAMGARTAFEEMLAKPETRLLGLRGLFGEARRRGDQTAARSFAEEAAREKPGLGWAGNALLEYQAAEGEWAAALETLGGISTEGTIDAGHGQRIKAVLLTARAAEVETGEPEAAKDLALEAHRLAPDLVPAAVLAARVASRLGDAKRASRTIETTWKIEPHPDLAAAYMTIRPGESGRDRLKRMRQLIRIRANHVEGQLALARAAIDAKDWIVARDELRSVVSTHPTERAFIMMAEIEEGEHGDIGRARDWLSRAVRAPRDATWMADGYAFDHWEPVSPISGRIDAFEWKQPIERLPGAPETEDQFAPAPLPSVADLIEPRADAERAAAMAELQDREDADLPRDGAAEPSAAPEATGREVATVPGRALFPVAPRIDIVRDEESGRPIATDIEPETDEPVVVAAPPPPAGREAMLNGTRQPDDPGPDIETSEPPVPPPAARKARRFRLFS